MVSLVKWQNINKLHASLFSHSLLRFLFYYCVLIGMSAYWIEVGNIDVMLTNQEIMEQYKGGDQGNIAKGARDIYLHGWIQGNNRWLINAWPPGPFIIQGLVLKVFGANVAIPLVLCLIYAAFGSVFFTLLSRFLSGYISSVFATLAPLVFLALDPFKFALSKALIFSEPLGFFGMLVGVVSLLLAVKEQNLFWSVVGGIALAVACYFRGYMWGFMLVASVLFVVVLLALLFIKKGQVIDSLQIKAGAVLILAFYLCAAPWMTYQAAYGPGFGWSGGKSAWRNLWLERPVKSPFYGVNVACRVNPDRCEEVTLFIKENGRYSRKAFKYAKHQAIMTLIEHPIEWGEIKLDKFVEYWFHSHGEVSVQSVILAVLAIVNFLMFFLIYKAGGREVLWALAWIYSSFLLAAFVVSVLVHLEMRYLYPYKLLVALCSVVCFSYYYSLVKKDDGD